MDPLGVAAPEASDPGERKLWVVVMALYFMAKATVLHGAECLGEVQLDNVNISLSVHSWCHPLLQCMKAGETEPSGDEPTMQRGNTRKASP